VRGRGVCLAGPPTDTVFPPVPSDDYLDAILADFRDASAQIERTCVYVVLKACRIWGILRIERVLSKDEGGMWASCSRRSPRIGARTRP